MILLLYSANWVFKLPSFDIKLITQFTNEICTLQNGYMKFMRPKHNIRHHVELFSKASISTKLNLSMKLFIISDIRSVKYHPRPSPVFTPSASSASPPRLPVWPTTTATQPSPTGKSRLPCVCSCPENWPSTLNLHHLNKYIYISQQRVSILFP